MSDPTGTKRGAVVCIAAGVQQRPVVRAARALGLEVIGVDRDPDAAAFPDCDDHVVASTHDAGAVIAALAPLRARHRFQGVLVRSAGPPVVTAAEVARFLGLPGVPPESACTIIDKERLNGACRAAGIAVPELRAGATLDEIAPGSLRFPCIVKPALGLVGKRAIRLVSQPGELARAFEHARAASLTGRVNVEAFVPGLDVGLVSVVRDGVLEPITLIDEWNELDATGTLRPRGVAAPSRFSGGPEEAAILALAQRLVERFGLRRSAFMMAVRITPGGEPVLTEIHLDLGGDRILDDLLPASAPFDVLTHSVASLSGIASDAVSHAFQPAGILFHDGPAAVGPAPRSARVLIADDRRALDLAMGRA